MRRSIILAMAAGVAALAAAYAELVLDVRTPRANLVQRTALGASASLSLKEYNKKLAEMRSAYGEERVDLTLETSTGHVTVSLDGRIIEEWDIEREFGGIYGLFVVGAHSLPQSTFPFALNPGTPPFGHEPNIERLRGHFEGILPAGNLAFRDEDWSRDACASPTWSELGLGRLAQWLHLQSQTFCVVHWNGVAAASMLISVTLADGDPWMRPFARRLCGLLTVAALEKLAAGGNRRPDYAACVLVDRPHRTGPTGTQHAFTSAVYEVRKTGLARIL
jgi:hypothetical protein